MWAGVGPASPGSSSEECPEEDGTSNYGSMAANNAIVEEEDTVKDDKDNGLVDDPDKADSAIQTRAAKLFALLNK